MAANDGSSGTPAFYFDLASAECYLAAERIPHVLAAPVDWRPVLGSELAPRPRRGPISDRAAGRAAVADATQSRGAIERRAAQLGLQPLRWPDDHPFDSAQAMVAATFARRIGRGVAFAQAAFRQAFAGGHSLARLDHVLLAAAACEMHPAAVLRALELRGAREELRRATREAASAGVVELPAISLGGSVFSGPAAVEEAAAERHTQPAIRMGAGRGRALEVLAG